MVKQFGVNQDTKLIQKNYDLILSLAGDKPIALGEVGKMPTPEILNNQPRWVWFMAWFDLSDKWDWWKEIQAIYNCDQTLTMEELPWVKLKHPKIHHPILK